MADNPVLIGPEVFQFVRKQGSSLLQVIAYLRLQMDGGDIIFVDESGQLMIHGLSVRECIEIIRIDINAGHGKIGTFLVQGVGHTWSQHNEIIFPDQVTVVAVR